MAGFSLLPFPGGVEAVAEKVQQHAGDVLRVEFDRRDVRIEGSLQRDVEALILRAGAVVGEVQGFLGQIVQVDRAPLTRCAARMFQHGPDNAVGAPAMLDDFAQVARERGAEIVDIGAGVLVQRGESRRGGFLEFSQ